MKVIFQDEITGKTYESAYESAKECLEIECSHEGKYFFYNKDMKPVFPVTIDEFEDEVEYIVFRTQDEVENAKTFLSEFISENDIEGIFYEVGVFGFNLEEGIWENLEKKFEEIEEQMFRLEKTIKTLKESICKNNT